MTKNYKIDDTQLRKDLTDEERQVRVYEARIEEELSNKEEGWERRVAGLRFELKKLKV